VTEAKLEQLNKRRRELEGSPEEVARETIVLLPTHDDKASPDTSFSSMDSSVTALENEDRFLANSIAKKILGKNSASSEDGPPLTTKAIRDLNKAMTERVFSRYAIRIRFPDRCQLQGYFHPYHSMADIYAWIRGCLTSEAKDWEIYIAPPKTILLENDPRTLKEMQLFPAAVIYLAWKYQPSMSMAIATAAAVDHAVSVGGYFKEELLSRADDKVASSISEYIPHSMKLVESSTASSSLSSEAASSSANAVAEDRMSATSSADGKKKASAGSKPAWLKI
jgi:hypothetical protein